MKLHLLRISIIAWICFVISITYVASSDAEPDSRYIFFVSGSVSVAAALLALVQVGGRSRSSAAALLISSVAAPSVFLWVFNIFPLTLGLAVLAFPDSVWRDPRHGSVEG